MLYDSSRPLESSNQRDSNGWLSGSAAPRTTSSYRIFVVCLTQSARRLEQWVVEALKAKGAAVRVTSAPLQVREGARMRLVFAVRGPADVRGAIAAMINLLGADTCVRTVRWESDPQAA